MNDLEKGYLSGKLELNHLDLKSMNAQTMADTIHTSHQILTNLMD